MKGLFSSKKATVTDGVQHSFDQLVFHYFINDNCFSFSNYQVI